MSVFDSAGDSGEAFEVSPSPETVIAGPAFEGANVSRAGALSTMLGGDRDGVRSLTEELRSLGFSEELSTGERVWRDRTATQSLPDFREVRDQQGAFDRIGIWQSLNESGRPQDAIAFLVALLGSHLERESAAGAAALWRDLGQAGSVLSVPGGPRRWRLWDRLLDLWDEDWPPGPWLGLPWPPDPDSGARGHDEDLPAIPWDPEQWNETFRRLTSRFGDPYSDLFVVTVLARWRLGRGLRSPGRGHAIAGHVGVPTNRASGCPWTTATTTRGGRDTARGTGRVDNDPRHLGMEGGLVAAA